MPFSSDTIYIIYKKNAFVKWITMVITKPTILVKKTDGTQVRMTMEEFKVYREQSTGNKDVKENVVEEIKDVGIDNKEIDRDKEIGKLIAEPPTEDRTPIAEHKTNQTLPVKEGEHELATTTPVKDIFVDEAVYTKTLYPDKTSGQKHPTQGRSASGVENTKKKWTEDEHMSPLEDKTEELKQYNDLEILPDKKEDLFSEVLKKIKFSIPDDLQTRLHSLITSRVKEVRTDEQFQDYASRPVDKGGMGLDLEQAGELLQVVNDLWHLSAHNYKNKKIPEVIEQKPVIRTPEDLSDNEKIPDKNNHIFHTPTKEIGKPILHDVLGLDKGLITKKEDQISSEEKKSVGPVDEIENFSVTDLRRLGTDTKDSFKRLQSRFENLKDESIVLYLKSLIAWYGCPLFKQYQNLLKQALYEKKQLKDLADQGGDLSWEEISGVVELEKSFSF